MSNLLIIENEEYSMVYHKPWNTERNKELQYSVLKIPGEGYEFWQLSMLSCDSKQGMWSDPADKIVIKQQIRHT